MTITPLHQLTIIFNTFYTSSQVIHLPTNWQTSLGLSHFLTTVTPSHTSLLIPHNQHTSLSTNTPLLYLSHLSDDCHTSCQLSHLPISPNHSPITITPLQPINFSPWPLHLPSNWQTALGLSHFLTHLYDNLHTLMRTENYLITVTPPQQQSLLPKSCQYFTYGHHTSLTAVTSPVCTQSVVVPPHQQLLYMSNLSYMSRAPNMTYK